MTQLAAPTQAPLVLGKTDSQITSPAWMQYFQQQQDYYTNVLQWTDPMAAGFGKVEPPTPVVGLLAYADGVNWNPRGLNCSGYYWWDGSVWIPV